MDIVMEKEMQNFQKKEQLTKGNFDGIKNMAMGNMKNQNTSIMGSGKMMSNEGLESRFEKHQILLVKKLFTKECL